MDVYEIYLINFWKKIRPDENPEIMIPQILSDPTQRAFVQAAFEAGRIWQAEHPTASIDFPDYNVPEQNITETITSMEELMTLLSEIS